MVCEKETEISWYDTGCNASQGDEELCDWGGDVSFCVRTRVDTPFCLPSLVRRRHQCISAVQTQPPHTPNLKPPTQSQTWAQAEAALGYGGDNRGCAAFVDQCKC